MLTTMKKTYQTPTFEVVRIETQQMLAGSVDASLLGDTQDNESALTREMFLDGEY